MLPKKGAYVKRCNSQTKSMFFLIEDDDFIFVRKNIILFRIKSVQIFKQIFDCKPVYYKTFLETKIESYSDKATDFHDQEI